MIGTELAHFRIVAKLGEGGMGEVYRAEDRRLGRSVALKILPEAFTDDGDRVVRFEREARVLAGLNHPGIVAIHALEIHGSTSFLVMELVEGRTLEEELAGGPVPLQRFFELAVPLAEILAAAHERGVIHRDLKPSNIMVTDEGSVKVLDFGLAIARTPIAGTDDDETTRTLAPLTREHQIVGTAPYMSPEQLRSESLDARADLFSLGVVLFEMLAGQRPFLGDSMLDLISSILKEPAPDLAELRPGVPGAVAETVLRCLAKDREERFATALGLRDALLQCRDSGAPETRVAGDLDRPAVAVLPFSVLSPGEETEVLAVGLHSDLVGELSRVPGLQVISRASTLRYRSALESPREIGLKLRAGMLIQGTMQRAGSRVRVTAELIEAASETQRWSERFDRELSSENLFDLQGEVAGQIVRSLRTRLVGVGELVVSARPQTESLEAYRLYNMGRMQLDRRTRAGCMRAVEHFRRAVELDPEYVPAWVGLADAQGLIASYGYDAGAGSHAEAKRAALRALELDPGSAAAHASLAMFYAANQDIPAWEREIETALRLNPGYAEAHNWKSYYLQLTGRAAEGCASARRAVALDPLSAEAASNLSLGLLTTGDAEGALGEARRTAELSPGWTTALFYEALALLALDRPREAAARLSGLHVEWTGLGAEATLVVARMAAGDEAVARREAAALDPGTDPFAAGLARLALGEVDSGFELMQQTERLTDWPSLAVHFLYWEIWAAVRGDGRLRELVRRALTSWNLEPPQEGKNA